MCRGEIFWKINKRAGGKFFGRSIIVQVKINVQTMVESFYHCLPVPPQKSNTCLHIAFLIENIVKNVKITIIQSRGHCKDKIFYCHKVILSSQSEVFKSMLTNVDMVEASSGEIKIVDIAANVIETLLYYLYNFDHGRLPGMELSILQMKILYPRYVF